ncbi:MAG TPA: VOC family protein [Myxococcota bacterium]
MSDAPRLDHVAIGVARAQDALPWLVGELGGAAFAAGPGPGFRFWQFSFARGGLIELLEPDGPPGGFLHRFLAARGPGIHHVTFKVPDLRAAAARAARLGYQVVGMNELHPAWKEAFLHPKQAQGVVVQLAESHPELEPEEWSQPAFPPLPEPARERADVLGVRLRATSETQARRQWQELLGAEASAGERGLVFRWTDSPLVITALIDASAAPGPLGIEIATPRALRFPEPHEHALGARWLKTAGAG